MLYIDWCVLCNDVNLILNHGCVYVLVCILAFGDELLN